MKRLTKTVFLLMAVAMSFSFLLTGCTTPAKTTEPTTAPTSAAASAEATQEATPAPTQEALEPGKLVWLHMGPGASMPGNPMIAEALNKITKERFNTEIEFVYIDWLDYVTQYNLKMASGEPMDLVYACSWLDVFPNALRGAYYELDDLLPKYAPKTWADVTPAQWDQCRGGANNKIIIMPKNNERETGAPGMFYRGDWAKEAGLTKDIATIEELVQYWDFVKKNKQGVIPWNTSGNADSNQLLNMYMQFKTDYNSGLVGFGSYSILFGKSTEDPYTVVNIVNEPAYLDFAKLTKQWGDAGYWPEDLMGNSNNWYDMEQFVVGTSATYEHHANEFFTRSVTMEKAFPGSDPRAFLYAEGRGEFGTGDLLDNGCAVSANTKDAARCLMIYDAFRFDRDLYNLSQYGIDGTHYTLTADGKRQDPEGYDSKKVGFDFSFWGLRSDNMYVPKADDWAGKQYWVDKIKLWQDNYKGNPYEGFTFDASKLDNEMKAVNSTVTKWFPVIMFGKASGTPEEAVAAFSAELKTSGIDKIVTELQAQLDAFKAKKAG